MKHRDFELTKTPHRESPPIETKIDVCRECRHIQPTVVIRGWNVCYGCLSQIDRLFCEWRAQASDPGNRAAEIAASLDHEAMKEIEEGTKAELREAGDRVFKEGDDRG